MATPEKKKTSMGMEQNVESGLSYIALFITGLIFFFGEKDNKAIRFHALQSIALNIFIIGVAIVLAIFSALFLAISWVLWSIWGVISILIWIAMLVLWVFVMVRAFMGATVRLPVIADICDKLNK